MEFVLGNKCTLCGREFLVGEDMLTCTDCGPKGILDVVYDYDKMKKRINKKYFAENRNYSIWRYTPLMSIKGDSSTTLRVGWTPLYKAKGLAEKLGVKELYIKDEGLNPTASLKDRASVVAVVNALAEGKDTLACSSTGNAASSLAGNAARMGLKTVIFVPERAPAGKLAQLLIFGSKVISVAGDYRQTFELSDQAINRWGWYNRNAAINPHLVEGKKTVSLEIAEQFGWDIPDWVAVSVGDGCTVAGVYKGFYDLLQLGITDKIPKILGVQAAGCCPFYTSDKESRPLQPTTENTIADSIAVGVPRNPVKAIDAVRLSRGTWITVSDQQILAGMQLLGTTEGIFGEPAGVAGLAGLMEALKQGIIKVHEKIAVINTGNGLKDVQNAIRAAREPYRVKPDINELDGLFDNTDPI